MTGDFLFSVITAFYNFSAIMCTVYTWLNINLFICFDFVGM